MTKHCAFRRKQGHRKKRYIITFEQLKISSYGNKPDDIITASELEFERLYTTKTSTDDSPYSTLAISPVLRSFVRHGSEDEERKKPKSLKRVLGRFAENTSISGLPHLYNAKRTVGKVFWGVLVITGFCAMFVHLYFLFAEFLSWPKKTTISLGFNNLQLPAITLCNVNVIRRSRLDLAAEKLVAFTSKVDPANLLGVTDPDDVDVKPYDYDYGVEGSGSGDEYYYYYDYEDYHDETARESGFFERDKLSEIFTNFRGLYLNESRINRISMGHDFNKTLSNCAFNGYRCYSENFTLYQTPKYGNCYTLDMKNFVIKKPGPNAGLSLTLYLETHEYLPGVTDGYGLRVTLHAPNTVPFPEETGFFIPGGQESSIALKQTKITRIGRPYGNCAKDDEFKALYNKSYNRQSCLFLCKTTQTLQRCGCFDPMHAEILFSAKSSKKECSSQEEIKCMIKTTIQLTKKTISCECPDPCSRNFLKLSVYYEELNFQSIQEQPDIANAQFASDFGGAIGLWIGLSVLSMFEIIYLCGMIGGYIMEKSPEHVPAKQHRKKHNKRPYRGLKCSFSPNYNLHVSPYSDVQERTTERLGSNGGPLEKKFNINRKLRYPSADSREFDEHRTIPTKYHTNYGYRNQRW
ncbi:amiloride-sensitive sodium channel subunit alpha-like [Ylistrum balloti]|uniref:amiloride-sensitive sodium channel subunit alpha-like n=1 Tax=Ylistrum balloti TaxID=509963 RepID=UPI002905BA39|nr:amiloride-sensitive sodium channel subunit alpha-like [Ylistrum balloti]